jgi:hypothetical protein
MPKTMDPGDFDIHEFEKGKLKPLKVTRKERINPKVLKPLKREKKQPKRKRKKGRVFAAVVGNLLLPGIGNLVIKKNSAGAFLLAVNVLLLAITFSPTSALGFIGYRLGPRLPTAFSSSVLMPGAEAGTIALRPEMAAVAYFTLFIALAAWAHLAYLLLQKKK